MMKIAERFVAVALAGACAGGVRAEEADVVIGTFGEGGRENGEDKSKTRLELPPEQLRLLAA